MRLKAVGCRLKVERALARLSLSHHGSRVAGQAACISRFAFHLSRFTLAATALTLAACGNIEPWVKPYERAALADPIMSMDLHPVSSSYIHHVYEAREGARGALGSAGGGCGCN